MKVIMNACVWKSSMLQQAQYQTLTVTNQPHLTDASKTLLIFASSAAYKQAYAVV